MPLRYSFPRDVMANTPLPQKGGGAYAPPPLLVLLSSCSTQSSYLLVPLGAAGLTGVSQPGKKVLAIILAVCALVTLAYGRKYGRFCPSQGSPGPPHG